LIGSLVDSYGFKHNGLIKKTLSVKYQSVNHHIVSYYNLDDVNAGKHKRPRHDTHLNDIAPRDELVNYGFNVSAVDPEDIMAMEPWQAGIPIPIIPQGLLQKPHFHVLTDNASPSPDYTSPHILGSIATQFAASSIVTSHTHTLVESFSYRDYGCIGQGVIESLLHGHSCGETQMDPAIGSQEPQIKTETEMPEFQETLTSTSAGSSDWPLVPTLTIPSPSNRTVLECTTGSEITVR
jgi:hypothetical protein